MDEPCRLTMLFTEPAFLFGYLPVVLLVAALLRRRPGVAVAWLLAASLAFYGWSAPRRLLPIILVSVGVNYGAARWVGRAPGRRLPLLLGVGANLVGLAWFKYAGFLSANLGAAGLPVPALRVLLPIGISFFTFTQVAFLMDLHRGRARLRPGVAGLLDYGLFVTFFPHLVAGPILHHAEIMPQLRGLRVSAASLAQGLTWFAAGMGKKVLLADRVAGYADPAFAAAAQGAVPTADAWQGALAYALQLYFDFSGYSDMAIGLALMVGVVFPLNFFSPYRATSLIAFWQRWHMTLSRFLRDYLYIPLGGNRRGAGRRLLNLVATMLLGGLWHGAAWTFVLWGAIHGAALAVNHAWRGLTGWRMPGVAGQALTLGVVVLAWVPFRADGLAAAGRLWRAMLLPGALPASAPMAGWAWVAALSAVALLMPNTAQLFGAPGVAQARLHWRPGLGTAAAMGACLGVAAALSLAQPTAFLYFRF